MVRISQSGRAAPGAAGAVPHLAAAVTVTSCPLKLEAGDSDPAFTWSAKNHRIEPSANVSRSRSPVLTWLGRDMTSISESGAEVKPATATGSELSAAPTERS